MTEETNFDTPADMNDFTGLGAMDFDVNAEYKPDPLVPNGSLLGNVTNVIFNGKAGCITWSVALADNGGYCSDGETPVDGVTLVYNNWLPKPGDESEYSKNGKSTKRQSKINMMKDFSEHMKIDMSTPHKIAEAIQNSAWVGIAVRCDVNITEHKGKFRNEIKYMSAA